MRFPPGAVPNLPEPTHSVGSSWGIYHPSLTLRMFSFVALCIWNGGLRFELDMLLGNLLKLGASSKSSWMYVELWGLWMQIELAGSSLFTILHYQMQPSFLWCRNVRNYAKNIHFCLSIESLEGNEILKIPAEVGK